MLGWNVPWLPPYRDTAPPGSSVPLLVLMSMMPAVRRPYSEGNAPVISFSEEISRGLSDCPNALMPSGRMMPLSRYCRSL